jgi:hypothetical protein
MCHKKVAAAALIIQHRCNFFRAQAIGIIFNHRGRVDLSANFSSIL